MRQTYFVAGIISALLTLYICLLGIHSRTMMILLALTSVAAFILYGYDKLAATQRWRRIAEIQLLTLSLFGALPGALLGQAVFNHKISKRSFQRKFWFCSVVSLGILTGIFLSGQ